MPGAILPIIMGMKKGLTRLRPLGVDLDDSLLHEMQPAQTAAGDDPDPVSSWRGQW